MKKKVKKNEKPLSCVQERGLKKNKSEAKEQHTFIKYKNPSNYGGVKPLEPTKKFKIIYIFGKTTI